jgi:hypothetical protein
VRSPDPPPTFGRQNAVFWLLYGDGYCGMDILLVLCKSVDRFYTLTSQNPRPACVGLGYRVQPLERRRPFNTERARLHLEWGQVRVLYLGGRGSHLLGELVGGARRVEWHGARRAHGVQQQHGRLRAVRGRRMCYPLFKFRIAT